jgi:hypothetical protein
MIDPKNTSRCQNAIATLVALVVTAWPTASKAAIVASANFDDITAGGAAIVSQGGGIGWSTVWSSDSALTQTAATNVIVTTSGSNRAEVPTTAANGGTAFRGLASPLADAANNTYYVHFDAQNLNDSKRFFGVSLFSGTTERMLIGQGSNFGNWTINNLAIAAPGVADSGVDSSTAAQLLVKVVFGGVGVPESLTFWVNPNYSQGENSAANNAALIGTFTTSADWGTIDRLRIGGGNTGGSPSFPFTAHWIDNLAIQSSTPFTSTFDGDYNHDGFVDAADYVIWRDSDGSQLGYDNWRSNFGKGSAASSVAGNATSPGAVPEPSTRTLSALMLMLGITGIKGNLRKCTLMC